MVYWKRGDLTMKLKYLFFNMIGKELHKEWIEDIDFALLRALHYLIKTRGEEEEELINPNLTEVTNEAIENTLKWVEHLCLAFDPLKCPEEYRADAIVKESIPQTRNGNKLVYLIDFKGITAKSAKGVYAKCDYKKT